MNPKRVGIYRLVMKHGSDNFRASAVQGVIRRLLESGVEVLIHEPTINTATYFNSKLENDLSTFLSSVDIILANRITEELHPVKNKVFTRDLFGRDS